MKRIVSVVIRNLYHLPYGWFRLCKYAKNPDKYSEEERFALMLEFSNWMVEGGRISLEVYGGENIPYKNGYMIFPNHQGLFDGFAIANGFEKAFAEQAFTTVYKKELDSVPFVNKIFASVKAIALDREDAREGLRVVNRVADEVRDGRNYLFFAEGTRSKKRNQSLAFKGGSFKSAVKAKCPILPVALIDSYKVFDSDSTGKVTVQVHFLKALEYEEYKDLTTSQIADVVKASIDETIQKYDRPLVEEIRIGRKNNFIINISQTIHKHFFNKQSVKYN